MIAIALWQVDAAANEPPAWLAGCWEARTDDGTFREVWLGPAHGELVGAALATGATGVSWEHLRVGLVDGALAYVASPSGQGTVPFRATSIDAEAAVFEAPEHDFPQRITYRRTSSGLSARVEARDGEGWQGFELAFVPCGSEPAPAGPAAPPAPEGVPAPECAAADAELARMLRDLARADQKDRARRRYDGLAERDEVRLAAVRAVVDAARIGSPADAWHAGVVLQHGPATADHQRAFALFAWACAQGEDDACEWAPLAWDRSLVSAGRPQWFGTQRQGQLDEGTGEHQATCLVAVDAAATDADRARWGRPPIAETVAEIYTHNGREAPPGAGLEQLAADGLVCEPTTWSAGP